MNSWSKLDEEDSEEYELPSGNVNTSTTRHQHYTMEKDIVQSKEIDKDVSDRIRHSSQDINDLISKPTLDKDDRNGSKFKHKNNDIQILKQVS